MGLSIKKSNLVFHKKCIFFVAILSFSRSQNQVIRYLESILSLYINNIEHVRIPLKYFALLQRQYEINDAEHFTGSPVHLARDQSFLIRLFYKLLRMG